MKVQDHQAHGIVSELLRHRVAIRLIVVVEAV
jgi:hypothetical protein